MFLFERDIEFPNLPTYLIAYLVFIPLFVYRPLSAHIFTYVLIYFI
jgi:hypothetical protein